MMTRGMARSNGRLDRGGLSCAIALLIAGTACGRSGGPGGGGAASIDFCARLDAATTCTGSLQGCQEQLAVDDIEFPACGSQRGALLGCLASQSLICPSPNTLYAGATENTGNAFSLGSYTAWYPASCDAAAEEWTACRNCPAALKKLGEVALSAGDPVGEARCESRRASFLSCVQSEEALRCPDDATLEPAGAAAGALREIQLDGLLVRVSAKCSTAYDEWQTCAYCGGGLGWGKQGLDVGQKCSSDAACANGLSCVFNQCTAPCTPGAEPDPCQGRTFVDDACRNDDGRQTACSNIVDACVVPCESNDDCKSFEADGFCPGNGAILAPNPDSLVEYGYCFFGPCGEGWDGCTPEAPFQ